MPPELSDEMTRTGAASSAPAKGRPRSEAVSLSILEAALDLIAEHGTIADVSVEAIAERSGVSKATIYRRWASKEELIVTAVERLKAPIPATMPRTSLRADLVHIANNMRKTFGARDRKVFKCMMIAVKEPEYKQHHDLMVEQRRLFIRDTFAYWAERGHVAEDVDLDLAVAMFISPMLTIFVYGHYNELNRPETVEQFIDYVLRGIGGPRCESRGA